MKRSVNIKKAMAKDYKKYTEFHKFYNEFKREHTNLIDLETQFEKLTQEKDAYKIPHDIEVDSQLPYMVTTTRGHGVLPDDIRWDSSMNAITDFNNKVDNIYWNIETRYRYTTDAIHRTLEGLLNRMTFKQMEIQNSSIRPALKNEIKSKYTEIRRIKLQDSLRTLSQQTRNF